MFVSMTQHGPTPRPRDWLIPVGLLLLAAAGTAAVALPAAPQADIVAAVFPPWWSEQKVYGAIADADATVLRPTALPTVVVVRPVATTGRARLRAAGAWFAADPQVAAACLP